MPSSGPDNVEQTSKTEPWSGAQPYITDYLKRGKSLSNTPFQYNPGDTVVDFAPETQFGLAATTQRAMQGSPVNLAAQQNATNTLTGQYMSPDSNPWLKGAYDTAANDVTGRINSQFSNDNFGGTAHQEVLTRGLGEVANNMFGGNYQQERGRQMQTMGMAPQLAETDYRDMQALLGVGDARRGLATEYMNAGNQLYNDYINDPQKKLDNYGNVVRTGMGGGATTTSTSPNPNQSNGVANLIGTGLSIYGMMNGGFFSDVRLKSNIVKVGDHPKGFGIYEYDKFGRRERGVMAHEVEKVIPEAVTVHESGYKMVNYTMIGGE
jgi:hypothetical protein